jgi:Na+-transporting NADH:ubiquinone oxidoreductase subunit C
MKDKLYTIGFMIVVTAVATVAMTGTKVALEGRIENNRRLHEYRARLQAFGLLPKEASADRINTIHRDQVAVSDKKMSTGRDITIAYTDATQATVLAYGFAYEAQGLWGPIRGVLALDPQLEEITGFVVTEHQETPGLGARMTEPRFREDVIGLPADTPDAQGEYVDFVPPEAPAEKAAGEVNGISGATNTTDGLDRMFNTVLKEVRERFGDDPSVLQVT